MEWKNFFSPFNSFKVMCWREQFEAIVRGEIPTPVSVSLDSTNQCNLSCSMCQYQEYREQHPDTVSEEDLLWAADAIKKLGAVSCCYAGGGEGALHPSTGKVLRRLKDNGLEVGMITNGVYMDRFMDDLLYSLLWIGISIDAATPETFQKVKGGTPADFFKIINNIQYIIHHRKNGDPTVGYKFLITPENYHEIFQAAQLAKSLRVDFLHLRPAYNSKANYRPLWYPPQIKEALEMGQHAMALSSENFFVQCVTHKVEQDFSKIVLKKCEITPIAGLTFAADGYCYLCCVPKNTMIDTINGIKSIESIVKGEKVLTHNSRYREVIKTYKRKTDNVLEIHSTGWFEPLIVTPEHLVLTVKDNERYCSIVGKPCPPYNTWKKCISCTKHKKIIPKFVEAKSLKKGDWLFTPIERTETTLNIDLMTFSTYVPPKKGKIKYNFSSLMLDEELCWLIGLFVAEGNVIQYKNKKRKIDGIHFSLGINDLPLIPKLMDILWKKFKIKPVVVSKNNNINITISSVIIGNIFYNLIGCYCDKKKLPNIFLQLPVFLQKRILEGWSDGDGFHRLNDDTHHITTTSKELLNQMWKISLRCGYMGATYDWKILGQNRKQAYTLFINKHKKINRKSFFFDDYFVSKIKKINIIKKEMDVYNIEVNEDNSYVASSKAIHNCDLRGEEQGRLCKWNEILDVWGSEQHRKVLENLDPKKCPYRCTYSPYQDILENVFRKDKMRYRFP